jgi:hypothetical protein
MASGMGMRLEWIVVVLPVLPAQLAATALLVAIAPVSAAVPLTALVWQVRQGGIRGSKYTQHAIFRKIQLRVYILLELRREGNNPYL